MKNREINSASKENWNLSISDDVEFNDFAYGNNELESFVKANLEALEAWLISEGEDSAEVKEIGALNFFIESSAEEAGLVKEYLTASDCEELERVLYRQMNEAIQAIKPKLEDVA